LLGLGLVLIAFTALLRSDAEPRQSQGALSAPASRRRQRRAGRGRRARREKAVTSSANCSA